MEGTVTRIIADLVETHCNQSPTPLLSRSTLEDLQSLLDTNDPQLLDQFFFDLSSKSISPSALLPPLTTTMDSGPTHLSLMSSNAYLSLLLSPNSPVFTLFTPMSFLTLLRSLRRSLKARPPPPIGECHSSASACGGALVKKRKGRASKNNRRNACDDSDEYGNYSNGERESEFFDVRMLFSVLEKLVLVLDLIHLNRFPDSLKSLVHTVVEIPVLAIEIGGNVISFNRLTDLCSKILRQVLKSDHGEEGETAAEVLKSLAPLILAVKSPARSFALDFVKHLLRGIAKKNEGVKRALVNLPRYLAQKAPEKAEPRVLAVEATIEIVSAMELNDQIGFTEYVVKMTQGKANLRLLGVDLILNLMMFLKDPFGVYLDCEVKDLWGVHCLEALIQRCSDSSAGIRARALSNLSQLVGFLSSDDKNCAVLKEVLGLGEGGTKKVEGGINDVLRKRCMDEKANVRRAALVLVTKLTALMDANFDGVVLKIMGMACSDPLVSIRKAAISALSEALRTFSDEIVTIEWLHSVPRLITDNESSIQEECENLFLELVLDRISRAGSVEATYSDSTFSHSNIKAKGVEREIEALFPEGVLVFLKEICNGEVIPWVRKICTNLGKKKRLKPKLATALQNIIRTSESLWLSHSKPIEKWTAPPGTWFLLSEVSAYLSKAVGWKFLHHHWQLLDKFGPASGFNSSSGAENMYEHEEGSEPNSVAWAGDRVFLLQTISNVSVELPPESAADLAHNLLKRIEEFNMHSTEEFDKSDCAALRNNLIVTMADFCVRYTALVDCYISKITKCLCDPCELVRRQTFILLSRLLQRDYVKWRGVLFLRFLLSLVDESEKIRQLADFLFGNILKVKAPLLAYNSFVEAIYVLNDCNSHNGHSGSKNSRTENRIFSIRGSDENSRSKRMHIYVSLLKQMAPEHLLATFAKLCAEILASASDGMLNINDVAGQSVLQDAFQILACKEIRIPSGRGSQTDAGEIEEEGGDGGASAAAAKGRAITQAVRKGLIQNTIPIFIELKRLLESKNSPLIGSLMECLRILLKDYKNEIDEILVADKQLQKELIYDMQKYESTKAKLTAAEAVATIQNASGFLSPGAPKTASRTNGQDKVTEKLHNDSRVASAMADAAAAARARSVLREVNKGTLTPPLSSISVPKLKSNQGASGSQSDRPSDVLESLRRRQSFNSDDEN
ncbi:uncharacterized protein LOC110633017 isoform X2 [Hevea brasiliensis]|uniref:uncharacterized protein LOC110633017 isoform X2 n=1 Tax=Hevea brasiliensis TaxID=3981 RepID=UPI0025F7D75A|nr:uncharacterized protein LOC110633017 isoform X2 [Hevea brasiliensis]